MTKPFEFQSHESMRESAKRGARKRWGSRVLPKCEVCGEPRRRDSKTCSKECSHTLRERKRRAKLKAKEARKQDFIKQVPSGWGFIGGEE